MDYSKLINNAYKTIAQSVFTVGNKQLSQTCSNNSSVKKVQN